MTYIVNQYLELQKEVFEYINLYSFDAECLGIGTCAQESNLGTWNRQKNCHGILGAFGICQIEIKTYHDVINWLKKNAINIFTIIQSLIDDTQSELWNLQYNDKFNVAIMRVVYRSITVPLPDGNDINAMAMYWKNYYNRSGQGDISDFIDHYKKLVEPYL